MLVILTISIGQGDHPLPRVIHTFFFPTKPRMDEPARVDLPIDRTCGECGVLIEHEDMKPKDTTTEYHRLNRQMNDPNIDEMEEQRIRRQIRRVNKPILYKKYPICPECWVEIKDKEDRDYDSE